MTAYIKVYGDQWEVMTQTFLLPTASHSMRNNVTQIYFHGFKGFNLIAQLISPLSDFSWE